MASLRDALVRKGTVTVCLICGDKGETKLLIYCRKCGDSAVHHYCMDDISPNDDNIDWVCWDCALEYNGKKAIPEIPSQFEEPVSDPTRSRALAEEQPSSSRQYYNDNSDYDEEEHEAGPAPRDDDGDSWILRQPAPGGPVITDLIPSFGGHVAMDIWLERRRERGLLKCQSRITTLSRWRGPLDEESMTLMQGSGIYHLRDCMFSRHNVPLLCAFVERWQPDTNTFHMPFGEMTITLHDVFYILGLQVEGMPVSTWANRSDMVAICAEIFSVNPSTMETMWVADGPRFQDIVKHCGDASGASPVSCARGYLMYLLGCSLFVDKSKNRVRQRFCPLLQDISIVSQYAWGAGALAYLYRQLGISSRAEAKQLSGCLALLESWIYEYFPRLRPAQSNTYVVGQPRCKRWQSANRMAPNKYEKLIEYRILLDGLTANDVHWIPYGSDVVQHVPKTLYHGTIRYLDYIEPYMPNRVLRQFGFVQIIPADPILPMSGSKRPRNARRYKVSYPANDREWMTPAVHMLQIDFYGIRAIPPSAADSEYMTWYIARSHPRIQNSKQVLVPEQEEMMKEPIPYPAIYDLAHALYPVFSYVQPNASYEQMRNAVNKAEHILQPFVQYLRLDKTAKPDEREVRRRGSDRGRGERSKRGEVAADLS